MKHVIERDEFLRRMPAVACLSAQTVDPPDHPLVEVRIHAHLVEHALPILQEAGKDVVEVGDRKRIVRAEVADGAQRAGSAAIPGFPRRIAIANEQYVFRLRSSRYQHGDGFGLCKSCDVPEVAVLPKVVLDVVVAVANRGGRQDSDRVASHQPHELTATAREFIPSDGFDELGGLRALCGLVGLRDLQCSAASGGGGWSRSGSSSSNTSCTPTRTNSTSSA